MQNTLLIPELPTENFELKKIALPVIATVANPPKAPPSPAEPEPTPLPAEEESTRRDDAGIAPQAPGVEIIELLPEKEEEETEEES